MWQKLKELFRRKSEVRPVMGGPIQPDSEDTLWQRVRKFLKM